jgi:predicted nucleotidyltransferase
MTARLSDLLGPFDRLLRACGIPYVLIGGYAVAAWGTVRATQDVDLLCETADAKRLADLLTASGYRTDYRVGDPDDPVSAVVRVEVALGDALHRLDFLSGIRGAPPGIIERARKVTLDGVDLPVASPEDMVILKLLAGSARDLEDARGIVLTQGPGLSRELLRSLCPPALWDGLESVLRKQP